MHEELTLDGVKYISAKRAAEITQYSKDYIGQLCREGKILANRIGRNWYVAEKSIIRHKTENGTDVPIASQLKQEKNTRLLDSLSKGHEEKELNFSRSKGRVYNEPLATYHSDDRPLLPDLKREERKETEDKKESLQKDDGYTVHISVVDSHANVPTKYIDKKPARAVTVYLEKAIVASLFIAVSLGLFMANSDYSGVIHTGISELTAASALSAFDQTAEFVNKTVDDTIYNYLYASLLNN